MDERNLEGDTLNRMVKVAECPSEQFPKTSGNFNRFCCDGWDAR